MVYQKNQLKDTVIIVPPNTNMKKKSASLPLNDPSSNIRQYLYVNMRLNRKLKPIGPKYRKFVMSRHSCKRRTISVLKIRRGKRDNLEINGIFLHKNIFVTHH